MFVSDDYSIQMIFGYEDFVLVSRVKFAFVLPF